MDYVKQYIALIRHAETRILPDGANLVLNGCELQMFAIEHKLNHKGLKIASRSNCQFKDYKIKDISQEGPK